MAIFVFGAPKSGTSLVETLLQALGVNPRPEAEAASGATPAAADKSMTARALNDAVLKRNNLDWTTLPTIGADGPLADTEGYGQSITDLVQDLDRTQAWSFGDPRFSFLLPHWKTAIKPASAIICLRRPGAVAAELKEARGVSASHAVALWELYTLAALRNTRRMTRAVVTYEELLAKPEAVIKKLIARLPELTRLDPGPAAIRAAVAAVLKEADRKATSDAEIGDAAANDLYKSLAGGETAIANEVAVQSRAIEIVRIEAEREQARRQVTAANEQLAQANAKLSSQKALFARHAEKLRNIVSLISNPDQPVSTDWTALLDQLYDAVRTLIGPKSTLHSEESVAEMLRAKDERIEWMRQELAATSARSQAALDRLSTIEIEAVRLRAECEQHGLARALNQEHIARLAEDVQRLTEQLSQSEQERAQADTIMAGLQGAVDEHQAQAAALSHAASLLEHRNRELAEHLVRDQEAVARLPALEADIEHLRRELQRISMREKDLSSALTGRDEAEKLLRATISQQIDAASALQAELTLAREDAEMLNARLAQQAALLAEYAALQFADRQALIDAELHIQRLEASAAESSQSSDRMSALQAEVQRAQAERDNAIKALKSYESAQDKQLGELTALARRAIAERDQALAGVAARDEAIRERDAALVEMHRLAANGQQAPSSSSEKSHAG